MFSGLVQQTGHIASLESRGGDVHIAVRVDDAHRAINLGDSVAINGVCLSVVQIKNNLWYFDVSRETLSCTLFGVYSSGQRVNLETALRAGDALGGHLVSGHVDGMATVSCINTVARGRVLTLCTDASLAKFIAAKGSVCIDGVSLTVNTVHDKKNTCMFTTNIIPHTLQTTLCGEYEKGTRVHVEVDIIARYVVRCLDACTREGKACDE